MRPISGDSRYESEADYNRKYEAAYQSAYSAAYASADASGERGSISEVEVQGIGSIADVNSANTSTFEASSDLIEGAVRADSIGNGNASAGASLGTSSLPAKPTTQRLVPLCRHLPVVAWKLDYHWHQRASAGGVTKYNLHRCRNNCPTDSRIYG